MNNKRSSKEKIQSIINTKNIFKGFRITYQVFWNLLLIITVVLVSGLLFVAGTGAGYFAALVKDEPIRSYEEMKADIYDFEEVSEIYFANGELVGEVRSDDVVRREIPLSDVSQHLINAIVATEDEYFFEHEGIVPKAILRATYQEFSNASIQTGGSTLTQQLIKNQILTSEVSFDRKAAEILLAMRLENFFEKEEILEAYLNVVPFGRNANGRNIAGVQAAAQGIFGVEAKDLNIPQAAYIAGLPQSPFAYTPFNSPARENRIKNDISAGINRMHTVLNRMKDKGYIDQAQFDEALAYDIRGNLAEPSLDSVDKYPYLTAEVIRRTEEILRDQLLEADGIKLEAIEDIEERNKISREYRALANRNLRRNGYKIYTTIDKGIYDAHQEIAKDDSFFPKVVDSDGKGIEVGAVMIDNRTGAIVSFVGGRYSVEREELNRATQGGRPNGSTMKPIVAYAPAMEMGVVQPGMIIPDTEYYYRYEPEKEVTNWDNDHKGLLTVRESLALSRNVPAVKSLTLIPHDYAKQKIHSMGIKENVYDASALGPSNITVEANTAAYATFANGGTFVETYMIEKIETKEGDVLFENSSNSNEVFSEQTAFLITDMLRDVLRSPGTAARLPGMLDFKADIAGKTGTSNETRDSWFVGYNPNFSLGVWIGFDGNDRIPTRNLSNGRGDHGVGAITQRIWAELANSAYHLNPDFISKDSQFQMPGGIVRQSFCGITGLRPSDLCKEAGLVKTDLFNAKFLPTGVDNSLERVKYVTIQGEPYLALPNTPPEFVKEGISVNHEFFEDDSILDSLPEKWNIIPHRDAKDNGKNPAAMQTVKLQGSTITWGEHPENDIVGYRVYRASNGSTNFTVVGTVRSDENLTFKADSNNYAYHVTAVDVAGRESQPSNTITTGNWQEKIEEEEKKEDKDKDKKNEQPSQPPRPTQPPVNNGGNNSDNNNNNDTEQPAENQNRH